MRENQGRVKRAVRFGGKGKGGKSNNSQQVRPTLNATLEAAKAVGTSEAAVAALAQDVGQAKQQRQSIAAGFYSSVAKVKRAKAEFTRAEELMAKALSRQERAAQAASDAER